MNNSLPLSPKGLQPDEMRTELGQFGGLLKANQSIPPAWAKWLGDALVKISRGVDAHKALGLTRRVGAPRKVEPHEIASERGLEGAPAHPDEFPEPDKKTGVWKESKSRQIPSQEDAAENLGISEQTVHRAEKKWREQVKKDRS